MLTYKDAGVDIDAGMDFVKRIQKLFPDIGGFGGLYPLGDQYLVAGTDGVGTKLKVAFMMNRHNTIGIDLVAMNVNDVLTSGARPLFFLDYFATSKLYVDQAEEIIKGIAEGCRQANCALLGGETAEMPGFYSDGEYDLGGFCVGIVDKKDLIDGRHIIEGDNIVGIASSGIHSNGYSLVHHILKQSKIHLEDKFQDTTIGQVLLTPTRIYVKTILSALEWCDIKGMAHITGGGIPDNVPRIIPAGLGVEIFEGSWPVLDIFQWLQKLGNVPKDEMYRTFNMGIGMVLVLSPEHAKQFCNKHDDAAIIGKVVKGNGVVFQ